MSAPKRLLFSSTPMGGEPLHSPPVQDVHPAAEEWTKWWGGVNAKDLVDHSVVLVDANTAVEDVCETLLAKNLTCVAVKSADDDTILGLFDFADVNAFLTLAATQHTLTREDLQANPRAESILTAAKSGKVPAYLVSNLSGKNSLEVLPHDATLLSLLAVFSRGTHRVLIRASDQSSDFAGFVTDGAALTYITSTARSTASLTRYLTNPLSALQLPSLYLYTAVVSVSSTASALDAMKMMSEDGVSSVAVLEEGSGRLLSAVSVTDVGKVVVPTQSNHILTTEMHQLISLIRGPLGSTDGEEHYPVYSVTPDNSLSYTVQKLVATNAHRLFVTDPQVGGSTSAAALEDLCGVVSIVDILALFARVANVPDVDPLRAQTRRRMSTSSTRSSRSGSSRSSSISSLSSSRVRVNSNGLRAYSPGVSTTGISTAGSNAIPIPIPIPIPNSRSANPRSASVGRGSPASPRLSRSFGGGDGPQSPSS